jgi:hypothetical protein
VVIKAWRIFVVVALLLIVVVRFGIWVWPPPTPAAAQLKIEPAVKIAEQKETSPAKHLPEAQSVKPSLKHHSRVEAYPLTIPKTGAQQSNSGGINVQQATTGDHSPIVNSPISINTDREVTPSVAKKLQDSLTGKPAGTVWLSCVPGDAEQQNLAHGLVDALGKIPGWNPRLGTASMIIGRAIHGIEVQIPETQKDTGEVLVNALEAAGLKAYGVKRPDNSSDPPGDISAWIGGKQ